MKQGLVPLFSHEQRDGWPRDGDGGDNESTKVRAKASMTGDNEMSMEETLSSQAREGAHGWEAGRQAREASGCGGSGRQRSPMGGDHQSKDHRPAMMRTS